MKAFLAILWAGFRAFPGHARQGLRPGVGPEEDSPARRLRRNFLYHLHPLKVRATTLQPSTTLGLGIISLALFAVLAVSGVLLMLPYIPTTRDAYASMQDIQYAVPLGAYLRALHRWAAHGMVVCVLLHLVRVVASAAYRKRELNWLFGLGLFVFTLGLAYTGYLLPWDGRAYWAVTVSTAMLDNIPWVGPPLKTLILGGPQVAQATLNRFYVLHVALLPAALMLLAALHLWRIRKDGGLALSTHQPEDAPTVAAWPHLVLREGVVALGVLVILGLVSLWVEPPLGVIPDPQAPANPEKAPWYFLGFQEMVSYSAPVGSVVFPLVFLFLLLLLPLLDRDEQDTGRWWGSASQRRTLVGWGVVAGVTFAAFQVGYHSGFSVWVSDKPVWVQDWLNPASGMCLLALLGFLWTGSRTLSIRSAWLAALSVLMVAWVGCTWVGLCRGPEWVFYWPWEKWPLVY